MVQIRILSGKKAGSSLAARRFPVRIGRSPESELQVEEPGVWDKHLRLDLQPGQGFLLSTEGEALCTVNSERLQEPVLLRSGDNIEIGSVRLQFWLADARQRGLSLREWLTWIALGAISLSQIALIYFVLN